MFIKKMVLACLGLVMGAGVAAAEPIPIRDLSAYLNSLKTATSSFRQISSGGAVDTGTFYMQRPYRVRFEYATQPTLVLAAAGNVAVFDGKSSGAAQQYPMSQTPLSLILAPTVNLETQGSIVGHGEVNGNTIVTVRDPSGRTPGTIEMLFTPGPELRQWVTTDELGDRTTVILEGLRGGVNFRDSTFSIQQEIAKRNPQR